MADDNDSSAATFARFLLIIPGLLAMGLSYAAWRDGDGIALAMGVAGIGAFLWGILGSREQMARVFRIASRRRD